MENEKISKDEMLEAIKNSGYLIEQRVEPVFRKHDLFIQTNHVYLDSETGKTREIDITGFSGKELSEDTSNYDFLFYYVVAECENNKQPVVFFKSKSKSFHFDGDPLKISGIPLQIYHENKKNNQSISSHLKLDEFHHYHKDVISTQYCSFQQTNKSNKKNWLALHQENQHDSFNNLIKFINYEMENHLNTYHFPIDNKNVDINLQLYYPLIILQGDLCLAEIKHGVLEINSTNHVQYIKQIIDNNKATRFHIDVIKESYLSDYLKLIDRETDRITTRIKRNYDSFIRSKEILVNHLNENPLDSTKTILGT